MPRENAKARRSAKRHAAHRAAVVATAEEAMSAIFATAAKAPIASVAVLVPSSSPDPESAALAVLEPFARQVVG